MKRVLLLCVLVGLFAGQASADLWSVDKPTALGMTSYTMEEGTKVLDFGVYDGPSTLVSGDAGAPAIYGAMSGQVGFQTTLTANDPDGVAPFIGDATIKIYDPSPGLTDVTLYDGIAMYINNDNNSHWLYQLFYVDAGGEHTSGAFVHLPGGGSMYLTVPDPDGAGGLDLADIEQIGFRVQGHDMHNPLGGALQDEPSFTDTFHTSVVPIPGALLLAFLGLGAAGVKLRRFA